MTIEPRIVYKLYINVLNVLLQIPALQANNITMHQLAVRIVQKIVLQLWKWSNVSHVHLISSPLVLGV